MSFLRTAILTVALSVAQVAGAQSVQEHIAAADRDYTAQNAASAYAHYEAAIKADPSNYEALWKAARTAIDLGEGAPDAATRKRHYAAGEQLARRAVAANTRDAEGHYTLARALGRTALSLGTRERIKYAGDVRAHALEALKIDPAHAGALHVMGMWNAEVMRLNGVSRMIAKNFLGGQVFGTASWAEAQRYLEEAVRVDPDHITHRLDLGLVYRDVDKPAKAREMLESVVRGRELEPNDPRYKREAAEALKKL